MAKYLNGDGLSHLMTKLKTWAADTFAPKSHTHDYTKTRVKGNAESSYRTGDVNLTPANVGAVALSGNETVAGNKTFTGATTAYSLKVGQHVMSDTTVRDQGIEVLDIRNAPLYVNSLSQKANFFFKNTGVPKAGWWSILHVKGGTGAYAAWELAGPANNADERKTPLYVRTGDASNNWSPWRALAETSMIDEVFSRGEQLVVNGTAFMGDNTNFSVFSYDGAKANMSGGSFTRASTIGATPILDEFIPIDASQTYEISFDAISANGDAKIYGCLFCFDIDGNGIDSDKVLFVTGSTTTLARDLVAGDTYVYFNDVSGFDPSGRDVNGAYSRKLIFWDYTNSKGYTYPVETYSRHLLSASGGLWDSHASIDYENNRILMKSAYSGSTVPAGTPVSQGNSGSTYEYVAAVNATVPTSWTKYKGYARPKGGSIPPGTTANCAFRAGTAKVRFGFLWNYGSTASNLQSQIWVTNVSMRSSVKGEIVLWAKNNTVIGSLGWSNNKDEAIPITSNTLAYWNGAYQGTTSNLAYCNKGAFGTMATKNSLAESDIPSLSTDKLTSGTLGVARGGTGKATHTSNAVLTGNGTSAVNNVATASGALYATAANGAPSFGTLPIAQGGTGKTTAADAWTALGGGAIGKKASLAASDIPAHASTATTYGAASTSNYGHAKLSSATNSSSEALAATPKAVKAAYDLANDANTTAGNALSAATGALAFKVTYSISNGTTTCAAHVYSAGAEVTSTFADSCFQWYYDIGSGWVSLGTGKTKAVTTLSDFGGNVKCDFTPPES